MEAVNEKELCLEEIPSSVLFCLWLYGHAQVIDGKRKINQCIEKAPDLCYPFFISLRL